jgi:uncharacterized membrane protein
MKKNFQRFWEIDFIRGCAVLAMILFHFCFDMSFLGIWNPTSCWLFWDLFPRCIGGTFIFLAGLSLSISFSRIESKLSRREIYQKYLWRGTKILSLGFVITFVTWLFIGEGIIWFGILHLIGAVILLFFSLAKHPYTALPLGIAMFLAGIFLGSATSDIPWLLWIGLKPAGFYTLDYYPLLPWGGMALFGIFAGNLLYPGGKRRLNVSMFIDKSPVRFIPKICWLGNHSLVIYLVHQPVIVGLLYLVSLLLG